MFEILNCTLGNVKMNGDEVKIIPDLIHNVINVVKIAIPVILIVLGMIDLGKAVTSNDEKQMKEAQKTLIKRVIYAVLIFFIVALVQFVFSALAPDSKDNITGCIKCFVNGSDDC